MGGAPLFLVRTGCDFLVATFLLLCFLMVAGGVSKMAVWCWRDVLVLLDLLSSSGVRGWAAAATSSSAPRFLVDLVDLVDLLTAGEGGETEDLDSSWTGVLTELDLERLIVDL